MKSEVRNGISFPYAMLWWEDTLEPIVRRYEDGDRANLRPYDGDDEVLIGCDIKTITERMFLGLDDNVCEVWISLKKDNTINADEEISTNSV